MNNIARALFPEPAMRRDPVFLAAVYAAAYAVQNDHDLEPDRKPTSVLGYDVVDGQEVDHVNLPEGANATDALVRRFRAMLFDSDADRKRVMQALIEVVADLLSGLGYQVEIG